MDGKFNTRLELLPPAQRELWTQPITALKALTYFADGELADLPGQVRQTLTDLAQGIRELPPIPMARVPLAVAP